MHILSDMVLLNSLKFNNQIISNILAFAFVLLFSTFTSVAFEEGPGCTDTNACNYDATATEDDGSCEYLSCLVFGCADTAACNYDPDVDFDNGTCEYLTCIGCMDTTACDYDPDALIAGQCVDFSSCYGCMEQDADNYDATATQAGDCEYNGCTFDGACNYDETANTDDGSCEYTTCAGCTNPAACNYDVTAIINSGNCDYPDTGYDCDGNCTVDTDGDGVCNMFEVLGCNDTTANNYDSNATEDDGSCTYTIEGCTDMTACNFNSSANSDDGSCEFTSCAGCTNPTACNYDADAIYPADCEFPDSGYNCDGSCESDSDGDGVCDPFEVDGCTNSLACNYNANATDDDGSCDLITCYGCTDSTACNYDSTATLDDSSCEFTSCLEYGCMDNGACNYDANAEANDGSCEYTTCAGCTNPLACDYDSTATISTTCTDYTSCVGCMDSTADNYDADATISNSEDCIFSGCTTPTACNYDSNANSDDGSCEYLSCAGCLNSSACNYDADAILSADCTFPETGYNCDGNCITDTDSDGICDDFEIDGCTDASANNYSSTATDDDGSCTYTVEGCTDPTACNYNSSANSDDGTCEFTSCAGCLNSSACNYDANAIYPADCEFAETYYDCNNDCLNDTDSDGVCDELEVDGCTDSSACNYNATATNDDGTCDYSSCNVLGCINQFACNYNENATLDDGSCEFVSCLSFGCTNPSACNYDSEVNYDDGTCEYSTCAGCMNSEACDYDPTALIGAPCTDFTSCSGCMDEDADNYDPEATIDDGGCVISGCTLSGACNYNPDANTNDGSCDFFSCLPTGCMNAIACNYDPTAVIAGDCEYADTGYDCDGVCLEDTDGDGICNPFEIEGCTDTNALNYESEATDDDGSCIMPIEGCTTSAACNFNPLANTDDGSCEYTSCIGCMAPSACNYDSAALIPGTCEYPDEGYDCDGICLFDTDGDGVCDIFEIYGCTLENSLNYDSEATENDGSCILIVHGCTDEDACNFNSNANVDDSSCEYVSCLGCMDTTACDYDPTATLSGECTFAQTGYYCDGACTADFDGDGICDMFEIEGCVDETACNFNEEATDSDDSCVYAEAEYNCDGTCISDQDGDEICDAFETAPNLVIPPHITVECTDTVYGTATTSGGCSTPTLTYSDFIITGSCPNNYVIMRTYMSSDNCGNLSTATQAITVDDTTAPIFTYVPADYSAECSDELIYGDATATDNCGEVSITVSEETNTGNCSGEYTITRTFTATDECGNASTATQTITLTDTTSPVFTLVPDGFTAECSDNLVLQNATATDSCGDVIITIDTVTTPGECAGDYTLTRTFTATDDCGNSSTANQVITVIDTTAPILTIPNNYTAECSDNHPMAAANATDNCGTVNISLQQDTIAGDCTGEYVITRTFTATDDCGNSSSDTQTISIVDTTAPTINDFPQDLSLDCDDANPVIYPTAYDLCSESSITLEESTEAGENDNYVLSRTFTATDVCGNSTSQTQTITVADASAPSFTYIPSDYVDECSGELPMEMPLAVDNCGDVSITIDEVTEAGNCAGDYTLTRTFTATDNAGNSATATQVITVTDTTAPVLSIPADYTAECSDDHPMDAASATDNCGSVQVSMVISTTAGNCAGDYTITRTFTATDDCGNSTSAIQTITIIDTTAPELSIPADFTAECSDDLVLQNATATDNCGEVSISINTETTPGTCAGYYIMSRTFTATDDCGNSTSATQTITFTDTTAPVLIIPSDYTAECSDTHPMDNATATDNCGEVTIYVNESTVPGSCAGNYVITRTFTATDDCGNTSIASQTITIVDTTAPVISYPSDYTAECSAEHPMEDATAVDNCGTSSISVSEVTIPGSCDGSYTIARTFTAVDDCGNSSSATQTITIVDTTPPVLYIPADYTAECSDLHPMEAATATDNCSNVTISVDAVTTNGNCAGDYTITRTFTATDDCGNTTSATQTITIIDTTAPALVIPNDYTAECSDEHPMEDATATDNCGQVTITVNESTTLGNCIGNYTITRTFTATDDCGNSTSATQTITIQDTTAPVLSVPADYTAECSDEHPMEDATATDNCGDVTISVSTTTTPGACTGNYVITRTFTATDDCGNSTSEDQTIVIVDTTAPILSIPADYTAECSDQHPMEDASATDNCGSVSITINETTTQGSCLSNYTITRTFTATDDCGNFSSATQTITITDTTAPVFSFVPNDYTAECSDPHPMLNAVASDNCDDVSISVNEVNTPGSCDGEYTITRTFTASDACGNSSSATQVINIIDTTAPVFTYIPSSYTAECSDEQPMENATATDNCSDVEISVDTTTSTGNCEGFYTITRTFTATDDCGNSTSATQTITIQDTTAPVLSVPADFTAECSDNLVVENATATDNCSNVTVSHSDVITTGSCSGEYTITRTFTAIDDCGNSSTGVQIITITDTTGPELTIPSNYTAECSDQHPMDDAFASDGCGDVSISVVESTLPGACAGNYIINRTFTATDDCGNTTSATQTITIIDSTAPVLTIPSNYSAECSDQHPMDDATATDNCGQVSISVDENTTPGICDGEYIITRTFTATDDCGNATSATQTITITDTTAPQFTSIPADYTAECSDEHPMNDAVATDNCSNVTITIDVSNSQGACAGDYIITRTFTATDECGNSTSATQTITIVDTTAPVLTIPADYTAECSDEHPMDPATASDNCGAVSIEVVETIDNSLENGYLIIRQFTATDDCGNSSSGIQTITILDTTAPVIDAPADYTAECSEEHPMDDATATDNCGDVTISVETTSSTGGCDGEQTITRVFTAVDDAGNSSTTTQTITIVDTTAPELNIPEDYTTECSNVIVMDDATASDNCSEVDITVESSTLPGSCAGNYIINRTFTAIDACGNTSTATQSIIVIDTTAPSLSIPADYSAECNDVLVFDDATASDNCGSVTIDIEEETIDGSCAGEYTITRTFTATDDCGNTSSATQTITITDTTAPEFTFIPEGFTAECSDMLPDEEAIATDNCSNVVISIEETNTPGSCDGENTITRTFTATDDCGNTTTATQVISLVDTTAPEFISIPSDYTIECSDEIPLESATASDACGNVDISIDDITTSGSCSGEYIISRTYTATDGCGNSTAATQTITVVDTTGPDIILPANYSAGCELDLVYEDATAEDACGTVVSIELTSVDTVITSIENGTYIINRTFTATDDCGNEASETQVITVNGSVPDGYCDCDGNQLDALGECGGDCPSDINEDGICDTEQVEGCTDEASCNYNPDAVINDGSCWDAVYGYDCNDECLDDTDGDGVCDLNEIPGCTDPDNPGYNPNATDEDGSCLVGGCIFDTACNYDPDADYQIPGTCDFESCKGCIDPDACNYDPTALFTDYSCIYPDDGYDCNGECIQDIDDDGVCDVDEIFGCTDPTNPGYDPLATEEDGSCLVSGCALPFACNYNPNADYTVISLCEFVSCQGCTDETACNYDPDATLDNGSCEGDAEEYYDCDGNCQNDTDGDGVCDELEVYGCTDSSTPTYNPFATEDDGSCLVPGCILPFACNYDPDADYLSIAMCDFSSCIGCMDESACNFDPTASLSSSTMCEYPENEFVDCDGICFNDVDGDGVCDELEILGCTNISAVNYNPEATEEDGSCSFDFVGGCNLTFACNYDPSADYYLPGSCDFSCLFGMPMDGPCMDEMACNYESAMGCNYFDENGDICAIGGCTMEDACNYSEDAQYNDGSCEFSDCTTGCVYENALNYNPTAKYDDGSCLFEGCTNSAFESYNAYANHMGASDCYNSPLNADFNADSKVELGDLLSFLQVYATVAPEFGGQVWAKEACNIEAYSSEQLLAGIEGGCAYEGALNFSDEVINDEGACVFPGCTDESALNFNSISNVDDGTCKYTPCPDFNGDGKIMTDDLLDFLVVWGIVCE